MTAAPKLDRIDRRILAALQDDARLTNQALSERVALSPSACLARVKRLEVAGVIQGYHARLDPFTLGAGLVLYADITLEGHTPAELSRFEKAIAAIPEVVEASHVTGSFDYILKVVVTDMAEWTRIAETLASSDLGVDRINTHVVMRKPKFFTGYPVSIE
ncbi:MAG TPA: Lrp/AsnC family transcriptional regulator [Sphingomicrobium sp.]|jgi:DNA-binding Lrp family transcriptional regulator|nr:Lrp/AsnC family transcriptional regulator [Sphingomicrobium sp.]